MIRLFVVDDHALFREGLVRLFEGEQDFSVCGSAGSLEEAVQRLPGTNPDVLLLDVDLGGARGLHLLESMRPGPCKVLVVTAGVGDREAVLMIRAGAAGIVHKQRPPAELCAAIRAVARGGVVLDERWARLLADSSPPRMTEREVRITKLILRGASNKEIAGEIGAAESTVKAALRTLFEKMGISTRSQLVKVALEQYQDQLT